MKDKPKKPPLFLFALTVVVVVLSLSAAPRRRGVKANPAERAQPAAPAVAVMRDAAPLDRLLYEAVTSWLFCSMDDDAWVAERTRICTQPDGEEYDFYVKLADATKAVTTAETCRKAIDALNALENYIKSASETQNSNIKNAFGSRDKRSSWGGVSYEKSRRKVSNSLLQYMLSTATSIPARRMIEGWLASRDDCYIGHLEAEVVESGFTPGLMIMDGLRAELDSWNASSARYGRCCGMWAIREKRSGKVLESCQKMSAEVKNIREAVSGRNARPDTAKKVIKNSLANLDREVRLYNGVQVSVLKDLLSSCYRQFNQKDDEDAMYMEIQEDYERLLVRISDSLRDPAQKKLVEDRLAAQRRHIKSVKDKQKKKNSAGGFGR